ncbi:hypothetical protein LMIY3S_00980 [Labrys miyagiensis]
MRKSVPSAAILLSVVALGAGRAEVLRPHARLISEQIVKNSSDISYAAILRQAAQKGWHYQPADIAAGYRHHFEEMKQRLIDQGYTIVPDIGG